MRRLLLVSCVVLAVSVLLAPPAAHAGGKVAVTWDCGEPDPAHTLGAGDRPDHAFMIAQVQCKAVSGEIAGIKNQKGTGTEFHEVEGGDDSFKGVFVETLANGDTIHYTYEGTAKMTEEGALASATNTWKATGGTGMFEGIEANGTCEAAPKADGGATFECTGEYSLNE